MTKLELVRFWLMTVSAAVILAVLVASPAVVSAQPAAKIAEDGEIIGLLDFSVTGVSDTAARAFEDNVERGLADNGYQVAPRSRMTELLGTSSYAPGCLFGSCLAEVHRNTEVRLVLVVHISALGPAYTFVMTLLDTRTGRPLSQITERCEVCTVEEAITTAALAVVGVTEGAGSAVVDPALAASTDGTIPDFQELVAAREAEISSRRRRLRQSALFFLSAAILAGGAGAYFVANDERHRGAPAIAVGGAFAVASGTLLVLSRRF